MPRPEPVPLLGLGDRVARRAGLRERAVRARGRARRTSSSASRRSRCDAPAARAWRCSRARTNRRSATSCSRPASRPRPPACCCGALPGLGHGRARRLRTARRQRPGRGRRLAHARGRARRVARDRDARRLGRGLQAPHELEPPQPGSPPRASAGGARQPRDVARDHRRGRAEGPARRVRAPPHALAGAARRLDVRPAGGAALPAGGAAAAGRRGPLRDAHAAPRRAAHRLPLLVRRGQLDLPAPQRLRREPRRATGPASWPCAAASRRPPSAARAASSTSAAPSSSSATSRIASSRCTRASAWPAGRPATPTSRARNSRSRCASASSAASACTVSTCPARSARAATPTSS